MLLGKNCAVVASSVVFRRQGEEENANGMLPSLPPTNAANAALRVPFKESVRYDQRPVPPITLENEMMICL